MVTAPFALDEIATGRATLPAQLFCKFEQCIVLFVTAPTRMSGFLANIAGLFIACRAQTILRLNIDWGNVLAALGIVAVGPIFVIVLNSLIQVTNPNLITEHGHVLLEWQFLTTATGWE